MKQQGPWKPGVIFLLVLTLQPILQIRCDVIINEVGLQTSKEFIELYNPEAVPSILDEYTIVIYDGDSAHASKIISLQHGVILPNDYFVIGTSNINPSPDRIVGDGNVLPNGTNAVALYHGDVGQLVPDMPVTNDSLIDVIVYGNNGQRGTELTRTLSPGQAAMKIQSEHIESLNRCNGMDPVRLDQWMLRPITPGHQNNCTNSYPYNPAFPSLPFPAGQIDPDMPPFADTNLIQFILINEFDIESQYVELYDGGRGQVSLDGLMMVQYNGATSTVYANPIHFNGYKTNEEGYFLIASNNFHPTPDITLSTALSSNGVNAIALHFGLANELVYGSPVTSHQLADVVVYGYIPDPEDNYLVTVLSQGNLPLVEAINTASSIDRVRSLSRCHGWHRYMPHSFTTTEPSPKGDNICDLPDIVINEVNVEAEGIVLDEFVEIYDGGIGHQRLDGLVMVLYNGKTKRVYNSYDLTGYATDDRGFAVVGFVNNSNVNIPVAMDTDRGFLQPGLDAVALHLGAVQRYTQGTPISR